MRSLVQLVSIATPKGSLAHAVQQRPQVAPSPENKELQAQRAEIQAWLEQKPPLRLVRVHELLSRQGVKVGYTTLRRFTQAVPEDGAEYES